MVLVALGVVAASYLALLARGVRWAHLPALVVVAMLGTAAMRPAPVAIGAAVEQPVVVVEAPAEAPLPLPAGVPDRLTQWHPQVVAAASAHGVDPLLLYAFMEEESDGVADAISVDKAVGLMQIIPYERCAAGAFAYACSRPTMAELLDPAFNLNWAARHIAALVADYGVWEAAHRYYGYSDGTIDEWYADQVVGNYNRFRLAGINLIWPVPSDNVTQAFRNPVSYWPFFHAGIDIGSTPIGTPIYAALDGTVAYIGPVYDSRPTSGLGQWGTILSHEGGITTIYGHASAALVSAGDTVSAGQEIARVGNEGHSFGPHLHWEVSLCPYSGDPMRPTSRDETCYANPMSFNHTHIKENPQ